MGSGDDNDGTGTIYRLQLRGNVIMSTVSSVFLIRVIE